MFADESSLKNLSLSSTYLSADKSPKRSSTQRRADLVSAIELSVPPAMVACSNCARSGDVCYFAEERSRRYSCCLRKNIDCDGSFSLEEFRKVVDEKKVFKEKSRRKRKETARLRRALVQAQDALCAAETEDTEFQESLSRLEEVSSRMLRREMLALGVLNEQPPNESGAFADPDLPWSEIPVNDVVDWDAVFGVVGGEISG
ncbi:hypothetical protein LTR44_011501 [Exophiala sp. CCFEE 6388]|nr:hypothetical protein LTR44_011501 [Eurotiomycetes sp. CCFEE 6388]